MMNSVNHFHGSALAAVDGEIGHVTDMYFDDEAWALRYFVVDTGSFLASREVLISPRAVKQPLLQGGKRIDVALSRDQVAHSPPIDTHQPVSRRHELEQLRYYGYPTYWNVDTVWAMNAVPLVAPQGALGDEPLPLPAEETGGEDQHLRSCARVKGYDIHATDGTIGHVADFVFDNDSWKIRHLVVDTRNWWPGGKKVLIGTDAIDRIDWSENAVYVNTTRDAIRSCAAHVEPEAFQ